MSGYFGTYRGVVLDNADPTAEHRVQVQVPDVTGADPAAWALPEQPSATPPNVGDEVWVTYENGDESYPIWSLHATGAATSGGQAAGYQGTYRGTVLDNNDPSGYQRVQVQVPEVVAEQAMWANPGEPGAALPAIGDEVWIRFDNGDVSYPTWTGGSGTGGSGGASGASGAGGASGSQRAVVLDNNDPGGYRRLLIQLPEDPSGVSLWAMPDSQDGPVPEVGTEVGVHFEQGDKERPIWSP